MTREIYIKKEDINKIRQDIGENSVRFRLTMPTIPGLINDKNIHFTIVEDEPEIFINLCGVNIGLNTGDIALGLFTRRDKYVKVSNIKSVINDVWFGKLNNENLNIDIDIKYILNLLKLSDKLYKNDIIDNVLSRVKENENNLSPKSITLRYIREKIGKNVYSPEGFYFLWLVKEDKVISSLMTKLNDYCKVLNTLYIQMFVMKDDLIDIIYKYKQIGVEPCISYELISRGKFINNIKIGYDNSKTSALLFESSCKDEETLSYNFMNIARSTGWEQNVLFGIESIVEDNNVRILNKVLERFNIPEILNDMGLDIQEFIKGINKYKKELLPKLDGYTNIHNYNDPTQVSYQIYEFSKVLDSSMSMIKKNINNKE